MFNSLLAPGRSAAQIPGLIDRGAKCAMRHILTHFGSGWQGLDPEFKMTPEKIGMKEFMLTVKKGEEEVGYLTYSIKPGGVANVETTELFSGFRGQGLGKGMYAEAMKHAKAQGAIKFRSDIKVDPKTGIKTVSDDAAHLWESAQKAGIAEKIEGERGWVSNLFKLEQNMKRLMDTGEGAAISQAGTSLVPSILKGTARLAKNLL